jgi:hypothetical protein
LIAQGSEDLSLAAWVFALAITALGVAFTSGTPTARVVNAFVLGEMVALMGLTFGAHRSSVASRRRGHTAPLGAS